MTDTPKPKPAHIPTPFSPLTAREIMDRHFEYAGGPLPDCGNTHVPKGEWVDAYLKIFRDRRRAEVMGKPYTPPKPRFKEGDTVRIVPTITLKGDWRGVEAGDVGVIAGWLEYPASTTQVRLTTVTFWRAGVTIAVTEAVLEPVGGGGKDDTLTL